MKLKKCKQKIPLVHRTQRAAVSAYTSAFLPLFGLVMTFTSDLILSKIADPQITNKSSQTIVILCSAVTKRPWKWIFDNVWSGCKSNQFIFVPSSSSVEAKRPTQHIIGHFGDDFYRPDDQTNSVKALNETSWSSRSGLNPTRTTPPCYNNTTLGNRLHAQSKGPNVTKPICWTCKNHSHKCAADIVSRNPSQSCSDNIPS